MRSSVVQIGNDVADMSSLVDEFVSASLAAPLL
jgi:hypothetical protein